MATDVAVGQGELNALVSIEPHHAELLVLATMLKCGVAELDPAKPWNLALVLRQARG